MTKQRWLWKFLGWFLLVCTLGVVSCQALFSRSAESLALWSADEQS